MKPIHHHDGDLETSLDPNAKDWDRRASVPVTAEAAERAAFARMALAVKLREFETAFIRYEAAADDVNRLRRECQKLAYECDTQDQSLRLAIEGKIWGLR